MALVVDVAVGEHCSRRGESFVMTITEIPRSTQRKKGATKQRGCEWQLAYILGKDEFGNGELLV